MRKELEFPEIDESKIACVSKLIDFIAENGTSDYCRELTDLNRITGKNYTGNKLAEYWGYTSLDVISRQALVPHPPYIRDLSKNEIIEMIVLIKSHFENGEDVEAEYYAELLHKSLPVSNVFDYLMFEDEPELIVDKMLKDSRDNVIHL